MKKFLAWLWVGVCSLTIFLIIPIANAIQAFTSKHFGVAFFIRLLEGIVIVTFLVVFFNLFFRLKIRKVSQYVWLVVFLALYLYIGLVGLTNPSEAAHYLEYGLLGYLLFRGWRFSIPDGCVYLAALFSGALVGLVDEFIQWIVPGRYWNIPDIAENTLAICLVLLALWRGVRPKLASAKIAPESVRTVSILFAVNLIFMGLCLSNTSERTAALAKRFSFLTPLEKQEPMREAILKHEDPEIGTFYSRLTLSELKNVDKEQAAYHGQILRDWKDKSYAKFLGSYPALIFPFLHEMRVHLFRRDRRYEKGDSFVAYKENLILEGLFGETLRASGYQWPRETRARLEASIDKSDPYDSPVSKNVLYWLKEGPMWATILIILVLLIGYNAFLRKRPANAGSE